MKLFDKRWPWLALLVSLSVLAIGYVGYREVDRQRKEMLESKWVRTSSATVVRKGDGRVYYKIDSFDNLNLVVVELPIQSSECTIQTLATLILSIGTIASRLVHEYMCAISASAMANWRLSV